MLNLHTIRDSGIFSVRGSYSSVI